MKEKGVIDTHLIFLIFFVLLIDRQIYASSSLNNEDVHTITLKEAVRLALERNKGLLTFQKRLERAKAQVREATSDLYPKLALKGGSSFLKRIKPLKRYEATFKLDEKTYTFEFEEPKIEPYMTSLSLSLSQALFTGGRLLSNLKKAKEDLNIAELEYKINEEELIGKVAQAYYELIKAIEAKRVFEEELVRVHSLLEIIRARFKEGKIPEVEVKKVELDLRKLESKILKAEGEIEVKSNYLKRLIGLDPNLKIKVIEERPPKYEPLEFNEDEAISYALANRLEIKHVQSNLKAKELSLKIARAQYYPQISLFGSYEWVGEEDTFSKSIKDIKENQWSVRLEIELPIFDAGFRRSRVLSAKASYDEEKINLEEKKESIIYEVREAIIRLKEVASRIEVKRASLDLAKENLRIIRLKYEEGRSGLSEVLDLEDALTKVSLDYIESLIDYEYSRVMFYKAIGKIRNLF